MKKILAIILFVCTAQQALAQKQEIEQLILNIEKLAQFKKILQNMKKGYEVLSGGYNTIKNISEGNFNLHKVFLDKLLDVNPTVKNYYKVAAIIGYQKSILSEYKTAFNHFKQNKLFDAGEIEYIGNVYSRLINQSLSGLDDLIMVVTASKLRMSDEERLKAIDRIFNDMQDRLVFLRHFNSNTAVLALQKAKEQNDIDAMRGIHGVNR